MKRKTGDTLTERFEASACVGDRVDIVLFLFHCR